jgi:hypothetical protein
MPGRGLDGSSPSRSAYDMVLSEVAVRRDEVQGV